MSIPSRQISWGPQENLLWQISKQLEKLGYITANAGIPGPPGPAGLISNIYYGSFYSAVDQISSNINVAEAIQLEQTSLSNGVSIVNSSEITFQYAGIYNIAFSGQLHNRSGGGGGEHFHLWFRKNGIDIAESNSKITVPNGKYVVAAWNMFIQVNAGDYVQLVRYVDNTNITLEHIDATTNPVSPFTPSLIVTANRVG